MFRRDERPGVSPHRLIALGALAVALAAWSAAAEARVVVEFFASPRRSHDGRDVNELLVQAFNERQSAIEVRYTPAVGDWVQKVTVEMVAGTAADVIAGWESHLRGWIERGLALRLDDYLPAGYLDDFWPSHVAFFALPDGHYALPYYTGVSGLYYNPEMFDLAGVDYPDETWTWDTLVREAKKLTRPAEIGTPQWGFAVETGWDRFVQFVWENGGRVIEEGKIIGNRAFLDEPAALGAVRFQYDLIWTHRVAPRVPAIGSAWEAFWRGELAMWQSGSWDISATLRNSQVPWDVTLRPRGPVARSAIHTTDGFMVFVGTRHPEQAVEFVRFLTSRRAQEMMIQVAGLQPSRMSMSGRYVAELPAAREGYNVSVFVEQMAFARPAPLFTRHSEAMSLIFRTLDEVFWEGDLSIEPTLEELTRVLNALLGEH